MTSRYALYEIDTLRERFALDIGLPKGVKPRYNISPTQLVPVVVNRDGQRVIEKMIWGLVPNGAKDTNSVFRYKTFATRSEILLGKPALRAHLKSQRCIIPANGYYEWKQLEGGRRPFYIRPDDHQVFGMAALYSEWTDLEGTTHGTCSVLTTDSESESDMIPSRLPVLINQADEAEWLNLQIDDLSTLFRIIQPFDASRLEIIPVGDAVNSVKPNRPDLIERIVRPQ